jgi:hypothetical protein
MKLRLVYVVILVVLVLVVGSVVYGVVWLRQPASPAEQARKPQAEQAFLDEMEKLAPKAPPTQAEGTLPPVGGDTSAVPVIRVDPAVLDLGVVPRKGLTNHDVKVYNRGKATLEISKVTWSCGCVRASIDPAKKSVPPDGETAVTVTVDPSHISGFESEKTVTILSNDPANARMNIRVLAKIDPEFFLDPQTVDFGEVKKGAPVEKTMLFRQLTEEPIEILGLQPLSRAEDLELSFVKRPPSEWAVPDRAEYTITVRLPETVAPGRFDGRFLLNTTCQRVRAFPCVVKANVKAFYSISSPIRTLIVRTGIQPGDKNAPTATIMADRPFEIVDIQPTGNDLVVVTKPGPTPNSVTIETTLKPDAEPGQRNEAINFTVKSADEALKDRLAVRVFATKPGAVITPSIVNRRPDVVKVPPIPSAGLPEKGLSGAPAPVPAGAAQPIAPSAPLAAGRASSGR